MIIYHSKSRQTGSVLLEALVAILIFSIGILALVGMQGAAINNVSDAKYRSTAGFLANEMIGTVWATRLQPNSSVAAYTPDPTLCTPASAPCTATAASIAPWLTEVQNSLPNGSASIVQTAFTAGAASQVQVTICWTPPNAIAAINACGGTFAHQHSVSTFLN